MQKISTTKNHPREHDSKKNLEKTFVFSFIIGLCFISLAAFLNPSPFALDDYTENIARVLPVERNTFSHILLSRQFRSPIPQIYIFAVGHIAKALGTTTPALQISTVMLLLGIFCLSSLFFCLPRIWNFIFEGKRKKNLWILYILISLFSLSPFIYTRLLFESICIPYFVFFIYFLVKYYKNTGNPKIQLALSLCFLALASLFRPHLGVCGLVVFGLVIQKKVLSEFLIFCNLGVLLFILTGLFDFLFFGRLHDSLLQYIDYNAKYSSNFGVSHPFVYIGALIILSFPPTFFYKWSQELLDDFKKMKILLAVMGIFVLIHSLIAHKEERFIIPLLPILLLLLTPLIKNLIEEKRWMRLSYFISVNTIILLVSVLLPAQKNFFDLARFLDKNSRIEQVIDLTYEAVFYPEAYMQNAVAYQTSPFYMFSWKYKPKDCKRAFIMREDIYEKFSSFFPEASPIATFPPGLGDQLLIKLNPERHKRKRTLYLLQGKDCQIFRSLVTSSG